MGTYGDSGAPASNTIYLDALMTTSLAAYRKTMVDNIFKDSAVLAYYRQAGAVDKQNGGQRINMPLMYGDNGTIKTHGGYSVLDTTPQEGITAAEYNWAEIAGTISISRKEERQNAGEGKLIDLLKSKITQAEMSMREKLNHDIVLGTVSGATFVPDTAADGSYGLAPLGYFMRKVSSTDPTVGGNVGNIAGATYSWWRPQVADFGSASTPTGGAFGVSVSTWAGLNVALKRLYNFCSRGSGGSPDLFIGDQITYESYENALDTKVRYQNTKMADMGFDNVKVRGATFIWDEVVPDLYTGTASLTYGSVFAINTQFMKLIIDSETDIITTPFVEPENQTAKTAKILFMGNMACSNLRKQGLAFRIAQTLVA